ncbi:MAG: pyridoxal phosphate-dependent aminotransferase [Candidatus Marinimicrobia bacterium]|nr:pyridoxal phosphate-dependent aminotransferase [Candidatus Neomarinimicrobiota bacterium]
MNYKLADRVNKIQPSFTLQMATIAAEMRAQGEDVINFSVGEPDFNTPRHIINAGKEAMDQGYTKYTAGPGMIEFREAICDKLKRENGIDFTKQNILVSNGEKQSLSIACQALFGKGDKVLVFRPYWVSFPEFIHLADAEPLLINTVDKNNFEPDFEDLLSKDLKNVKGLIMNSPSNPTGGIWREEAIVRILKIAKENNWTIISDECYERLVYDDEFISTEKINRDHNINTTVITCLSLSKTYAMTGWRIGYSAGPREIIKAMAKIQGQATSCANSIGQKAGIEALTGSQQCVDEMKTAFKKRRNLIVGLLNELPDVSCAIPGGAFYAFPNLGKYIGKKGNGKLLKDTFDISEYILESAKVVTVPGDGFGAPGHIRFSYATDSETIKEGIERVKSALEGIV